MTKNFCLSLLFFLLLNYLSIPAISESKDSSRRTSLVPFQYTVEKVLLMEIKAEIDPRMTRYVNFAFDEATKNKYDLIIIEMNTFGGLVDDADKIRTRILKSEIPVFILINNNAASAGALISIACDSIYMTEGSNIGAATVVTAQGEQAPDKYQSYMRSMMRSTAETNHRNPHLAEGMVDPTVTDSASKKGKVITFTTKEAIANKFCEAQINSIDELLRYHNISDAEITRFQLNPIQNLSSWFLNPIISSILILIIIGGLYFELQTPGVGFPLFAAIIAALLYFIPYYMEGLAANWEILLFIIGLGLLIVELVAIPGFGIVGILGILLMLASLFLAMINNIVFDFSLVDVPHFTKALSVLLISLLGGIGIVLIGGKRIFNSPVFQKMVLNETLSKFNTETQSAETNPLIGKKGIAKTDLRPSGKVEVDNTVYDANTFGNFIPKNESIIVMESRNNYLVVKREG